MSATTFEKGEMITDSYDVIDLLDIEKQVEIFAVDNKTRAGGAFFPYLNNTMFDLDEYFSSYSLP